MFGFKIAFGSFNILGFKIQFSESEANLEVLKL